MTESHADAPALPLAVTYVPDGRLADAVRALVGRVGALAGTPPGADAFAAVVQQVVTWATEHRSEIVGDVAMVFDREGDTLHGDLRWVAADAAPDVPPVAASTSPDVHVACAVSGLDVTCRVSCRCV